MTTELQAAFPWIMITVAGLGCLGLMGAVKTLVKMKPLAPVVGQSGAAKVVAVSADLRHYNIESPVADCVYYMGILARGGGHNGRHINAYLNVFEDRITINGPVRSLNQIAMKDIIRVETVVYSGVAHYMNTPQACGTATGDAPAVQVTFRTQGCNTTLGQLKENIKRINGLASYLESYS